MVSHLPFAALAMKDINAAEMAAGSDCPVADAVDPAPQSNMFQSMVSLNESGKMLSIPVFVACSPLILLEVGTTSLVGVGILAMPGLVHMPGPGVGSDG
jgi:hypothetical protein